jgi:hypothetical protein
MPLRTLLFVVALAVIILGLYLLVSDRGGSKITIKIANVGELSTSSLGLATVFVGAVLAYFCISAGEKSESATQGRQAQESQAVSNAAPPSVSVTQSSTGDDSPNIVNGGSVVFQVDKSKNNR